MLKISKTPRDFSSFLKEYLRSTHFPHPGCQLPKMKATKFSTFGIPLNLKNVMTPGGLFFVVSELRILGKGGMRGKKPYTESEGRCQSPRPVRRNPSVTFHCTVIASSLFFGLKNNPSLETWVGKDPNFTAMNQSILGNVWNKSLTWKNERFGHFGDRIL